MVKDNLIIYCDGGSRGNPGPAASAFVVTKAKKVIFKGSKYLGVETNNVAEYWSVKLAVEWIIKNLIKSGRNDLITINLDSQLVERQLNGVYKIKNENLKIISGQIKSLIYENNLTLKFIWNSRDKNHLADLLVNEELDKNKK